MYFDFHSGQYAQGLRKAWFTFTIKTKGRIDFTLRNENANPISNKFGCLFTWHSLGGVRVGWVTLKTTSATSVITNGSALPPTWSVRTPTHFQ